MKKILILLVLFTSIINASESTWNADISGGIYYSTHSLYIFNATSVRRSSTSDKIYLSTTISMSPEFDIPSKAATSLKFGYDKKIDRVWEVFGFSNLNSNMTTYMKNRWNLGIGAKYNLIRLLRMNVSFSLAPVFSRYVTSDDVSNRVGVSSRLKVNIIILDNLRLNATGFLVLTYGHNKIYNWLSNDVNFQYSINDRLDFFLGQEISYDINYKDLGYYSYIMITSKFK